MDFQVLAVAFQGMARVDGEECLDLVWVIWISDEAFVLTMRTDGVPIRKSQEDGLEFTERRRVDFRLDMAIFDVDAIEVLVAFCEFRFQHDFGMSIRILAADEREILCGHAEKACQVVGKGF